MSLAEKYRPCKLADYEGKKIRESVKKILADEKDMPHTFLLSGETGCGKTTLARIIAYELGSYDPDNPVNFDYYEMNTADFGGVDAMRSLLKNLSLAPLNAKYRVWLFDECHRLTPEAQDCLLKPAERLPNYAIFIFATTEPQKIIATLKGRCFHIDLNNKIERNEIEDFLNFIAKEEKIKIDKKEISKIADENPNSVRNAIKALEKIAFGLEDETEKITQATIDLCRTLVKGEKWDEIKKILAGLKGEEPEKIRRAVLGYCSSILLNKSDVKTFLIMDCFKESVFYTGFPGVVLACFEAMEAIKHS